jgi:ribonuclease HI
MQKILVNADGGARGNPGPAAVGIVVWNVQRSMLESYRRCIGTATNNVAEYTAVITALQRASKYSTEEVDVFMDSELVVRQLTGLYKVRAKHLLPYFQKVREVERLFRKVTYRYVSREDPYQKRADALVNEALDE